MAYEIGKFTLISSYHCSRYNTNTGVLTTEMFEDVVGKAKAWQEFEHDVIRPVEGRGSAVLPR